MNMKVIVVTHKITDLPFGGGGYMPICVGPNKDSFPKNIQRDDTGDNIANRNNQYSELTALYWAWKNLNADYIGIVHYRRYMSKKKCKSLNDILSVEEAMKELEKKDIIVVRPRVYLESVKQHFVNCHRTMKDVSARQLEILEETIQEETPEYITSFKKVMNGHSAHMFNMFIMSKENLDEYCSWMFPILFETESKIESENILFNRLMGSLSEFLLDTWIIKNNKSYKNMRLYQTEMDLFDRVKRFIYRRFLEK